MSRRRQRRMAQRHSQRFSDHLRCRRCAQKLTAAAGCRAGAATQIRCLIQRELTVREPYADGLNARGIFTNGRQQRYTAWDQHAREIATACQRHHHRREPFVARGDAQDAAPSRKRTDESAENAGGVVAIREAVEHRRRALRAAITWVGAHGGKRDGARVLENAGSRLHQQADFPVSRVIAEGDRGTVGRADAAVRRQNQELLAAQRRRHPTHPGVLASAEQITGRTAPEHCLGKRKRPTRPRGVSGNVEQFRTASVELIEAFGIHRLRIILLPSHCTVKVELNTMVSRSLLTLLVVLGCIAVPMNAAPPGEPDEGHEFTETIRPFLSTYCITCHGGEKPAAQLDLRQYATPESVVEDYSRWNRVLAKLTAREMPPKQMKQPSDEARQQVIDWIQATWKREARRNDGDPGTVLARRLSNAEYNYSIRDLTGVDIRPAREFPVDPANPSGFDNTGESLTMSPALFNKYLLATREVADHMALTPDGFIFAPGPVLAETDREKYCIQQIVDFYDRQATDYAEYFRAAWLYKHRSVFGKPRATLADIAAQNNVSARYLTTIYRRTAREASSDVARAAGFVHRRSSIVHRLSI